MISNTEEESKHLEEEYNSLSDTLKQNMKSKNWERVYDLTPFENDWAICGSSIQATFWELRREQIRSVRFFEGTKSKR